MPIWARPRGELGGEESAGERRRRERAVRELWTAVGREGAERILERMARIMERVKREPGLLACILGMMERDPTR